MKRSSTITCVALIALNLSAQDSDPFFTGSTPSLLDPSRAGFAPGIRATLLHQDRSMQQVGGWRNDALQVDWCARNTKKHVDSWIGIGFNVARDRQGTLGGRFTSLGIMPAMHLRSSARSYLSAGIDLRWMNAAYGDGAGAWGSQYDGLRYDASLPSGEAFNGDAQSWINARTGLSWTLKQEEESPRRRERDRLVIGVAADHLGRLVLREGGMPISAQPMRLSVYSIVEIPHGIWENGYFSGELFGHVQGPFHTARVGLFAGKHLLNIVRTEGGPTPIGFKTGLAYRYKDALLVNGALDIGKATIGMAYGWPILHGNIPGSSVRTFELMVCVLGIGRS